MIMKKIIFLFASFLFLLTGSIAHASSTNLNSNKFVSLPKDQVVDGNYYAGGETIEIDGVVNGDAYLFGGQVFVNGTINGDLISAAGTINLNGEVKGDARLAGGQANITGKIGKNLSLAGGNLDLGTNSKIGGALQGAGGNLNLLGSVGTETLLAAGNANIAGTLGDSLTAKVGTLRFGPNARVSGDVTYWGQEEATVDQSASISGSITRKELPFKTEKTPQRDFKNFVKGISIYSKLSSILLTLILGFILLKFFPNHTQRSAEIYTNKFWKSLLLGFLAMILVPIITLVTIITIIGIPLAFATLPIFILYVFMARVFAMVAIGSFLAKKANINQKITTTFLIGLVVYYVLTSIPILGELIKLVIILSSIGAAITSHHRSYLLCQKAKIA